MKTKPGDVLLIYQAGQPMAYARVEEITADVKPQWWQISLTILGVPPQELTWILREEYIDGQEFTMSGESIRLEAMAPPRALAGPEAQDEDAAEEESEGKSKGKVVSLDFSRKKK